MHPDEIVAAHARLAVPSDLVEQRRLVYSVVAELVCPTAPRPLTVPDVLDSPVARAGLGAAMATGCTVSATDLIPLSALSDRRWAVAVRDGSIPVSVTPAAPAALGAALDRVAVEIGQVAGEATRPALLTVADADRLVPALGTIGAGVALAEAAVPGLWADLLPHLGLLAVVENDGRLGSASVREFPGLVVVPAPGSAGEAAEALVHEGAHQKIFDLAATRDLLPSSAGSCPRFAPPWHADGVAWPLEQALAAWHAYLCLAALERGDRHRRTNPVPTGSLLPVAEERAVVLCAWLGEQRGHLGGDARRMLADLGGVPAVAEPVAPVHAGRLPAGARLRRRHGDRALYGVDGRHPEVFWTGPAPEPASG